MSDLHQYLTYWSLLSDSKSFICNFMGFELLGGLCVCVCVCLPAGTPDSLAVQSGMLTYCCKYCCAFLKGLVLMQLVLSILVKEGRLELFRNVMLVGVEVYVS